MHNIIICARIKEYLSILLNVERSDELMNVPIDFIFMFLLCVCVVCVLGI